MRGKTLQEEFELNKDNRHTNISLLTDYNIFKDKILLDNLRKKIIASIIDNNMEKSENLENYVNDIIDKSLEGYNLSISERDYVFNLIENELDSYGPLTPLLKDENITEIMVNGRDEIYLEIDGHIVKDESTSFINDEHILRTIERLIQPLGRTIDVNNPMVDSRLPDGSRINAIIPPLSIKGPVLTIRKFKNDIETIDDLLRGGTVTPYMARFLEACVKSKLNILVCGGTGSGKTTILNILSNFIEKDERIITIEDAVELRLKQSHVISLEVRNPNYDNGKPISIRNLVRNSLHMRPDRIIIGEVRGEEAFDMLQAMNTGHEGSLTTLHANSPVDSLNRLETMVLMSGIDLGVKAIRGYIESAIDIVVQIERLSDGKRKITSISEVVGLVDDNIKIKEIFAFKQKGLTKNNEVDGEFILYNYLPKVYDKIKRRGITLVDDIFKPIIESKKKK